MVAQRKRKVLSPRVPMAFHAMAEKFRGTCQNEIVKKNSHRDLEAWGKERGADPETDLARQRA